jgi:hypothetical protein
MVQVAQATVRYWRHVICSLLRGHGAETMQVESGRRQQAHLKTGIATDRFWPKLDTDGPSLAQCNEFMVALSVATIAGSQRLKAGRSRSMHVQSQLSLF